MVGFGGLGAIVLVLLLAGFGCLVLTLLLLRVAGRLRAVLIGLLVWSVAAVFVVTLIPAYGPPGVIPLEEAQTACSFDYGGPAPSGIWFITGGQRMLNTVLFVPAGVLVAVVLGTFRRGLRLVPLGAVALAGCSVLIEIVQLELTRLGRACDITDIVDNSVGALLGAVIGVVLAGSARLIRGGRSDAGATA